MFMAEHTTLAAIDREILRQLQENGRLSATALAEAVGLTPTPLRQRLERLESTGVIQGYCARVDAAAVGRPTLAFVHVTLRHHTLEIHEAFVRQIVTFPEIISAHHIAGEEDFILEVRVKDIAAFETFLLHKLTAIPGVGRIKTTFVLSTARAGGPIPVDPV